MKDTKEKANQASLQSIMDTVNDSIITIDEDGKILSSNKATSKLFGFSSEELLGNNINILTPSSQNYDHSVMIKNVSRASEAIGNGREIRALRKDGSSFQVEIHISEVFIDGKRQFTGVIKDITGRKISEEALRASEERFRQSQNFANIGSWEWNIVTGHLHWSDRIGQLFGYGEYVPESTYENFINAVHQDDREKVEQAITDAVEKNIPYTIEHRVTWRDGTVHWVLEQGAIIQDESGKSIKMLGVVSDINDRKLFEEKIQRQKELLELTQHCLTDFISSNDFTKTSDLLLQALLNITNSQYGFTGEVLYDEHNQPYLKTHSISDISWDEESHALFEQNVPDGMEFRNLNSLFGQTLTTGETLISNTPMEDDRAGGLPDGHPQLTAFLCVPVYYGKEFIGIYGLANRKQGYDETLVDFLSPFNASYGGIIHARRSEIISRQDKKDLIQAKKEADKANSAKSEFLSHMSHELRTPLNAVLGFAQLLETGKEKLTDGQQKKVNEILRGGNHLLNLINEVLELSKIESGRIDLNIEPVRFKPVFDECIALIQPLADESNIILKEDSAAELDVIIMTDKTRLKQILLNLLSNAVKYNRQNGFVVVNCSPQAGDYYRISVKDTGKGIPESSHAQVFTEFDRLGEERSNIEGNGIGLVITQKLVEIMNGNIGFESVENKGSTFWIDLPTSKVQQQTTSEKSAAILREESFTTKCNIIEILYIEDNPANLRLVEQILDTLDGINYKAVPDPILGLDIARSTLPGLILLDINMPEMNGYQVLEKLRKDPATKNIPVIAVSSDAMPENIGDALRSGFNDYVTKPIVIRDFIKTITSYIH